MDKVFRQREEIVTILDQNNAEVKIVLTMQCTNFTYSVFILTHVH